MKQKAIANIGEDQVNLNERIESKNKTPPKLNSQPVSQASKFQPSEYFELMAVFESLDVLIEKTDYCLDLAKSEHELYRQNTGGKAVVTKQVCKKLERSHNLSRKWLEFNQ